MTVPLASFQFRAQLGAPGSRERRALHEPAVENLVREALKTWKTPYRLHVCNDAEEALEFLNRADGTRPNLALVDLGLPKQPGFVVLEAIRKHPQLSGTVVIAFSSSAVKSDVDRAVPFAAAYLQKPMAWRDMIDLFAAIETFWRMDVRFRMKHKTTGTA
jgi:CheY-like chemotaxis protein